MYVIILAGMVFLRNCLKRFFGPAAKFPAANAFFSCVRVRMFPWAQCTKPQAIAGNFFLEKVQGATRLGATGPRASEREICLWEGLWKPLKNLWNPLKNLLKPLKTSENPLKTHPLRDPLKGGFPSQRLSVLLPLIVLPLELSPIF